MKKTDKNALLFGYPIFSRDKNYLLKKVGGYLLGESKTTYIFTPNPEQIVQATQDERFGKVLGRADLLIPDGNGLKWASHLLHQDQDQRIEERITGREVAEYLLGEAAARDLSVLVIGGVGYHSLNSSYAITKITSELLEKLPRQKSLRHSRQLPAVQTWSIYWMPGFSDKFRPQPSEALLISDAITKLQPQVVLVALGAPEQELWLDSHRDLLEKNGVRVAMVVGGALDVVFGRLAAPPSWVQTMGLEWLFRLIQQPWRWRRQLRLLSFVSLVFKEWLKRKK